MYLISGDIKNRLSHTVHVASLFFFSLQQPRTVCGSLECAPMIAVDSVSIKKVVLPFASVESQTKQGNFPVTIGLYNIYI